MMVPVLASISTHERALSCGAAGVMVVGLCIADAGTGAGVSAQAGVMQAQARARVSGNRRKVTDGGP